MEQEGPSPDEEQQQQQQQLLMVETALVDVGGEVEPSQTCPHLHSRVRIALDDLAVSMKRGCEACGAEAEPWVCLSCNGTRCSRYVQACNEAHFFETLGEGGGGGGGDGEGGSHCLALSLSDLSVWCYACNGYVKHDRLMPLLVRAEAVKFGSEEKRALLEGVQTSFHVGFTCPAAALGGGDEDAKPSRAEQVVQALRERSLLAKTVFVPSCDALLAAGNLPCGLAVVAEGDGRAEARRLAATAREGAAVVVEDEASAAAVIAGGQAPPPRPMVLLLVVVAAALPLAAAQELVAAVRRRGGAGPRLVVLCGDGAGPQAVEALLRACLSATE